MSHRHFVVAAAAAAVASAAVLLLAGCSAPQPDIAALADEMRPVVTAVAQLTFEDEVPADHYFDEPTGWCGNPIQPEHRGQERYYEHVPRGDMEKWGANGYTVETLTDATRELLVIPGWVLEESSDTGDGEGGFRSTDFTLVPEDGGARILVSVYGQSGEMADGGTLTLDILAMTACVPAGR